MTKFNFAVIVFDLETTDDEPREIIDIGAVALDRHLNEIGTFQTLVRPSRPVSDFVRDLTGYTRAELAAAADWPTAAERFEAWVAATVGGAKRCRLAAWGNYFDVNVLRGCYAAGGRPYPFSGTALDVKTAALLWAAMSGKRTDAMGVEKAAKLMDIKFAGRPHTALADAVTTARIFRRVAADLSGGVWVDGKYVEVRGR